MANKWYEELKKIKNVLNLEINSVLVSTFMNEETKEKIKSILSDLDERNSETKYIEIDDLISYNDYKKLLAFITNEKKEPKEPKTFFDVQGTIIKLKMLLNYDLGNSEEEILKLIELLENNNEDELDRLSIDKFIGIMNELEWYTFDKYYDDTKDYHIFVANILQERIKNGPIIINEQDRTGLAKAKLERLNKFKITCIDDEEEIKRKKQELKQTIYEIKYFIMPDLNLIDFTTYKSQRGTRRQ